MASLPSLSASGDAPFRHAAALCIGIAILAHALPARADDAGDVAALMRAGRLADAQALAENRLAQQPKDAHLALLRGMILAQQNKPAEAIAAFRKMTEDFPTLPEPYNNLGVLLANAGEVDKARAAFELAIRLRPSYAAAHESLGDLYARLARNAYDKAAELDSADASARAKSASLRPVAGTIRAPSASAPSAIAAAGKTAAR